jgi:organic hydroperoxide reductase OsmC/OhrA
MGAQALPHHYEVRAYGTAEGDVRVSADGLPDLQTQAPPEFGGPEGYWSPETMLLGAIANCYVLSFRAVARASKLEWQSLGVDVEGVLERVEGVTRFTRFTLKPRLDLAAGASATLAETVLKKSKSVCLVTNSINADFKLAPSVQVADDAS